MDWCSKLHQVIAMISPRKLCPVDLYDVAYRGGKESFHPVGQMNFKMQERISKRNLGAVQYLYLDKDRAGTIQVPFSVLSGLSSEYSL